MLHVYVCLCMQHKVAIASYMATNEVLALFLWSVQDITSIAIVIIHVYLILDYMQ